jgi:hypothetical protein
VEAHYVSPFMTVQEQYDTRVEGARDWAGLCSNCITTGVCANTRTCEYPEFSTDA